MRSALLLRKSHQISEHRGKKKARRNGSQLGSMFAKKFIRTSKATDFLFLFFSSFHVQVIPEIRLKTYRADKGLGFGSSGTLKKRRMKLCLNSKKTFFFFTNLNKSSVRFKTDTYKNPF